MNSSPSLESRRLRVRQACVPCRQRKRRCDGNAPCGNCERFEYDCFFSDERRKRRSKPQVSTSSSAPTTNAQSFDVVVASDNSLDSGIDDSSMPISKLSPDEDLSTKPTSEQQGILDPLKIRYLSASSAVAFPRILGLDLNRERAPRLHAFAWHLGIRPELPQTRIGIAEIISLEELQKLKDVFFEILHPCFSFLDRAYFENKCLERWSGSGDYHFDCVIGGVAALGSLFSGLRGHPREEELVAITQSILDNGTVKCSPHINHVAGWILRTLYLRASARPSGAWLASCTLMHLIEATGLHRNVQSISIVSPTMPELTPEELEYRIRIAWMGRLVNIIIAYEYGRSGVSLDYTCRKPLANGDFPHALLQLVEMLPSDGKSPSDGISRITALRQALMQMGAIKVQHETHILLKADLIFCLYRRMRLLHASFSNADTDFIIETGRVALTASNSLASRFLPWWMVIGTPFQLACVLIAIDSTQSIALLPDIVIVLDGIVQLFDTHLAREAVATVRLLATLAYERKLEGVKIFEGFLPEAQACTQKREREAGMYIAGSIDGEESVGAATFFGWPDETMDWDVLAEPVFT